MPMPRSSSSQILQRLQALRIGEKAIRNSIQQQLGVLKSDARSSATSLPLLVKLAYPSTWTENVLTDLPMEESTRGLLFPTEGSRRQHERRRWIKRTELDDMDLLPDSSHLWGDGWNMEDLSLWSREDMKNAFGGFRRESAIVPDPLLPY